MLKIGRFFVSIPIMMIILFICIYLNIAVVGFILGYIKEFVEDIVMIFLPYSFEHIVKNFLDDTFEEIGIFIIFVLTHYFTLSIGENFLEIDNKYSKIITITAYILTIIISMIIYTFWNFDQILSAQQYISQQDQYMSSTEFVCTFIIAIFFFIGSKK